MLLLNIASTLYPIPYTLQAPTSYTHTLNPKLLARSTCGATARVPTPPTTARRPAPCVRPAPTTTTSDGRSASCARLGLTAPRLARPPLTFAISAPAGTSTPRQGRVVPVEPIKPVLKAPGSMLIRLRYDGPLSNFAFRFNRRRYTGGVPHTGLQLRTLRRAVQVELMKPNPR